MPRYCRNCGVIPHAKAPSEVNAPEHVLNTNPVTVPLPEFDTYTKFPVGSIVTPEAIEPAAAVPESVNVPVAPIAYTATLFAANAEL